MTSPQKQLKLSMGLLKYYKIKKMVHRWKKAMKNSRHRFNVLKQWIMTEQNYINDLNLILDKIQAPMIAGPQDKRLINQEQQIILFPNIKAIIKLSQELLSFLKQAQRGWHCRNTEISQKLISLYPFFRIYISYCNVFNKGQNILKNLKNHPTFKDIEKSLPMDVASYLIKPVQRPPKYMLLLRDYQRHMKPQHKDYHKLTQAITKYHQVNQINNDAIAKQARAQKMFYLQKLTGGALLSSSRQFLGQTKAFFQNLTVTLYRLTDLVIVCTALQSKETIIKMIFLDGSSYVEIIPDGKYFDTYLFLCGKSECIHLNFFNKEQQNSFCQIMNVTINSLLQKQDQRKSRFQKKYKPQVKVRVTLSDNKIQIFSKSIQFKIIVASAEKRPLSSIKNDTIYNVKFHIPKPWSLAQYIFLRYSTVQEIQGYIKKKFPQLQLPNLRPIDMGSYDQTKNSTKIVQFRKMAITQFLNVVFRNQRIMSNPLFLIEKLNIQENFWAYAIEDNKENCSCSLCTPKEPFNVDNFFEQKKYYITNFGALPKQKFCMKKYMNESHYLLTKIDITKINTFERILTWINYYQGRIDYSKIFKKEKKSKLAIRIYFPNLSQHYEELKIDSQTTVGDVMIQITKQFQINSMEDFGLFLEYNGTPRLLDSDENIIEVMQLIEEDVVEQPTNGILNRLHKWGTDLLHGKRSKVYLRKYLFLGKQLQSHAGANDFNRYTMVIQQIFYDVKNNKINLKREELVKIVAYFVCMKSFNRLQYIKKTNLPSDTIKLILPQTQQSLIQSSTWNEAVFEQISWIKQQISPPKSQNVLYDKILKLVQHKQSYKCFWFNATNYYPQTLKGQQTEVLIGVNFQNFMVLDAKTYELLIKIPLLELKYRITIYSIFIDDYEAKLRFDGRMLQSLSKIIQKYKIYNKMFKYLEFIKDMD